MKTIDDLIANHEELEQELLKLPEKNLNCLKSLTNIYVLACLENDTKQIVKQRATIDAYVKSVYKSYDIKTGHYKQMLDIVEAYYCKKENRAIYMGKEL